jgi:hypothetical protein
MRALIPSSMPAQARAPRARDVGTLVALTRSFSVAAVPSEPLPQSVTGDTGGVLANPICLAAIPSVLDASQPRNFRSRSDFSNSAGVGGLVAFISHDFQTPVRRGLAIVSLTTSARAVTR